LRPFFVACDELPMWPTTRSASQRRGNAGDRGCPVVVPFARRAFATRVAGPRLGRARRSRQVVCGVQSGLRRPEHEADGAVSACTGAYPRPDRGELRDAVAKVDGRGKAAKVISLKAVS
jgi:hypothetical protein